MQFRLQSFCSNCKLAKQKQMAKKIKHTTEEGTLDLGLDEMDAASQQETGPVTVLGMTFSNDEERRAYFREQLRTKLPKLRNIEGFPIGSDDDIINLSDPPYYTACPNPWLNDFIAEWEQEKHQLEAEGKRHPNVVVNEPYAADVSEGKANPIYLAHSYHTKVPHLAIMRYILHYTQPGDVIFDGFSGTGMTGVASNMCAVPPYVRDLGYNNAGVRHCILSDLSPIASLISASYNKGFNPILFERKAQKVLDTVENELGYLYEISLGGKESDITATVWSDVYTCPNCGKTIVLWNAAVDTTKNSIKNEFSCPHCGILCTKKTLVPNVLTEYDTILGETISVAQKVPVRTSLLSANGRSSIDGPIQSDLIAKIKSKSFNSHKTYRMPDGDEGRRNDKFGIKFTHQFYTKRAYIYLSRVYELVKDDISLLAWFTSSVISTTIMNRFRFSGTGVNSGTLYVPALNWEFSPYSTLKRKIQTFISAYYEGRGNCVVGVNSATDINNLANSSVDYIFTDPPFGANLSYSDLNSLWEGWLNIFTNSKDEAIVSRSQNKSVLEYQTLMFESFKEYYRILKPGKWMTVEFSNTSASVWNSIQTSLQNVGFVIANVSALDKQQGSFKAVTTTTAVKQDLIISCFKPSEQLLYKFENEVPETNVWDFIDELLSRLPVHLEHGNKTTAVVERSPKILYDRLISFYVQHGFPVPLNAQEFQTGLRERYAERDGMYFTPSQAAKYDELRKRTDGFQASLFFVDSEQGGIAWLNNELSTPQTYQDLQPKWMQAINGVRKGDILPELMQILEENFIKESDGKWRKPNLQDDVDLAALRHKALMREFKVYVEVAKKPRGKIKEARVEALRAGFKQSYQDKDFATIVTVGDRIPQNLLTEDEQLLQFYEIASSRV